MGVTTEKTAKKEKVVEVKLDTTNPLNKGVSYEVFLKNVTKTVTVDSLLKKANLTTEQIKWVKKEIKQFKINKK